MRNIAQELVQLVKNVNSGIIAASITLGSDELSPCYVLSSNSTLSERRLFFTALSDFDYDSDCGMQILFGTVWFKDGSWAVREEYDGAEWWKHVTRPVMP